jgi:hypothetical protein
MKWWRCNRGSWNASSTYIWVERCMEVRFYIWSAPLRSRKSQGSHMRKRLDCWRLTNTSTYSLANAEKTTSLENGTGTGLVWTWYDLVWLQQDTKHVQPLPVNVCNIIGTVLKIRGIVVIDFGEDVGTDYVQHIQWMGSVLPCPKQNFWNRISGLKPHDFRVDVLLIYR